MSVQEVIDRLHGVSVDDAVVLSVYLGLPPDPGERTRLETRQQRVEQYRAVGGHGVGVFLCYRLRLDESLALPRTLRDRVIADTTPWLRWGAPPEG